MRQRLDLNGDWQFLVDPADDVDPARLAEVAATVPVPGAWQAVPAWRDYQGTAWYRRAFTVPAGWPWPRARLHFGAVDYYTEVWLNGVRVRVGEHRGGYTPFFFEVGATLRPGPDNELVLRVLDPPDDHLRFPRRHILQGKQNWYGDVSGPWQDVYLEGLGEHVIEHAAITTWPDRQGIELAAEVAPAGPGLLLSVAVLAPDGRRVTEADCPVTGGTLRLSISISDPLLWSPDTPHLYTARLTLTHEGRPIDELAVRFGLRTIAAEGGRLLLNGQPVYPRGLLDQDYWPDGLYTPPSPDSWAEQFRRVKDMGFNLLRIHVKPPDPRYLDLCDELGLLVWEDLPYAVELGEPGWAELRETLHAIVRRDANHPSIIVRSLVNENWGADLPASQADRRRLLDLMAQARALDPSRLWVDNSACRGNFHLDTDVLDWHTYWAMPEHRDRWEKTLDEFAGRADWLWSPHGDAHVHGNEPLVLSEFGTWGLPDAPAIQEQWWAESGWLGCIPAGLAERFADSPLAHIFPALADAIAATQRAQVAALKVQVESLRRRPAIVGYVLTELADQNWEANGVLDMGRSPKLAADQLPAYNADNVLLLDGLPPAVRPGDVVRVRFLLSRYGPLAAQTLRWTVQPGGPSGQLALPGSMPVGVPVDLGAATFQAPSSDQLFTLTLTASLHNRAGQKVLTSSWTTLVVPPVQVEGLVYAHDPLKRGLAERLAALGYEVQSWPGHGPVVSTVLDQAVAEHLARGGAALLLLDSPDAIQDDSLGLEVIPREGPPLDGDWIGVWHWLDRGRMKDEGGRRRPERLRTEGMKGHSLGLGLPGGEFLGFAFGRVLPEAVFAELDEPWGGMTTGWLNEHFPWLGRVRHGEGWAIVTTLRLLHADPVAELLLGALVEQCPVWS